MPPEPSTPASHHARSIRLVWAPTKAAPAPWRLGLYSCHRPLRSIVPSQFQITRSGRPVYPRHLLLSVRGLLVWSALFLVSAELSAAGYLHSRYKEQPGNLVTFADLALPWRWSGIKSLRGRALIAQGKTAFDTNQFPLALDLLRAGIARHPDDPDSRLRVAALYVLFLRRDKADAVLLEALEYGDPGLEFLQGAITFLNDSDHPAQLVDFCRRARALVQESDPGRAQKLHALDTTAAFALLALGRPDEALAAASSLRSADPDFVGGIDTQAALDRNDLPAALSAVQAWRKARPDSRLAIVTAVGVNARVGNHAELDALLRELRRLNSADPSFASLGVTQNLVADRADAARAAFDDCIFRFGGDPRFLDNLARDIGRTGRLDFLDRLEFVMREQGLDRQFLLFSRLIAQLDQADWTAAALTQQALAAREATLTPEVRAFTKTTGALIEICAEDTAGPKLVLLDLLSRYRGRLKLYVKVIDWLVAAQRWETAQSALVLAEGVFPQSVQLAERRARIAPKIDELHIAQSAASVRSVRTPDDADAISDGDTLLTTLDRLRGQHDFSQALRIIQSVRHRDPAWLQPIEPEVDRRELAFALDANDLPQLQAAARQFLRDQQSDRLDQACELARARHAAGQKPTARILLGEVLRQTPDHALATKLLNEWDAAEKRETP